ncbi:hypothetical protein NCS57_01466300 [Fusarium keratoplasticum]|uniref:Uncharacterized protein n=1 Tax=Fusarium keratoplasticum TaxID=1328300 RepID=A0ACC0QBK4_9HYPO|nr:hypothetical protein NCS57_01466300 [Fusarium keratoplasticum]KAI8649296.1 hypothetical protein NCS57_01466300 [Fusarium keratoplasticum]
MFTKVSISTANVPGLTTAAAKTGMDSDNPTGNQVLFHTDLTEID